MNAIVLVRSACVALVVAGLFCASPTRAQQPSPAVMAAAKELAEIVGAAHEFDPVVTGIVVQSASVFLKANPALSKDLNEIVDLLISEYLPRRVEVQNQVIRLYAQRFSEQELKGILNFYNSALGKKLLAEGQIIREESMKWTDAWARKLAEEVSGRIRAELKKRGHNL